VLQARELAARELRIVAVTTAAEHVVPPLMQVFRERHPDIGLTLDVGIREHVFRRVLEHRADVAIGGRPPDGDRLVGDAYALRPQVLTLGSNGAIKQAARAGIGVSLQPRVAVELELSSGLLGCIRLRERLPADIGTRCARRWALSAPRSRRSWRSSAQRTRSVRSTLGRCRPRRPPRAACRRSSQRSCEAAISLSARPRPWRVCLPSIGERRARGPFS
jgi:DNA-binding transcriptional LysR family regulator